MTKGKLIVIEGSDRSGKKTQTELLVNRLRREGRSVTTLSFPRYGKPAAKKIEEYLKQNPTAVDPYEASKIYAEDRLDAAPEIQEALERGEIVVLDRYTPSNAGHQGGKIADPVDREEFIRWLYNYEYKTLRIPKPDLVAILHVPVKFSLELIEKTGGARDGHERDVQHLKNSEAAYLWLANKYPEDHKVIECVRDGKLLPPEEINNLLYQVIAPLLE